MYRNIENISKYFINLGFSNREAKILSYLLIYGPLTVGDLHRYTGIAKPHIYDLLKKLMSKGVILKMFERPSKYRIIDDKYFFMKIAEKTKNEIDLSIKEIIKMLSGKKRGGTIIIDNEKNFREMLYNELERVNSRCFIMVPKISLIKYVLDKIFSMYDMGINVRFATSDLEYVKSLSIQPSYVRYFEPKQPFMFCILDEKLFLVVIANKFLVGIFSSEENIVREFEEYFNHVWSDDYIRALYRLRMSLKKEY